jgi:hypothetical protein
MPTDTPDTEEPWSAADFVPGLGFETADAQHILAAIDRLTRQQYIGNLIALVDAKYANGSGAFVHLSDAAATEVTRLLGPDLGVEAFEVRTA